MNLSALMKGYKGMCEFINKLDISSCTNLDRHGIYKKIKCALTFVSSDMFGYLCQDNHEKICETYYSTKFADETYKNAHEMGWVASSMVTNDRFTAIHWEKSDSPYTDIHNIYTNGVSEKDALEIGRQCGYPIYKDKLVKYKGSCIIYTTMEATAQEILEQISHKKVRVTLITTEMIDLGEYSSAEEAQRKYADWENFPVQTETLDSKRQFVSHESNDYMTREEIEVEWKEDDEVDIHQEFEDNFKLGTFRQIFSPEAYEKVLEMNNYKFIKNDNGGKIVCNPPYTD